MSITCRFYPVSAADLESLARDPASLPQYLESHKHRTDISWFWHGLDFLHEKLGSPAPARFLLSGGQAIPGEGELPPSRLHGVSDTAAIGDVLNLHEPEAFLPVYLPAVMDAAGVYPRQWAELDEEHDILGDLLELYSYLQEFAAQCRDEETGILVHFVHLEDGTEF